MEQPRYTFSAQNGYINIVKILVEGGADTEKKFKSGCNTSFSCISKWLHGYCCLPRGEEGKHQRYNRKWNLCKKIGKTKEIKNT
ncbi:hypothetical protein TVAGG3_0049930 [Trichomonas vaginalis G3]|uniref:hypothetical protein n=1 Tax=Trichomonas vaginalis (strain ATCC PRA-98 / G3) TaxID=412133 RepID=UPI0021E54E0F|nr:hypothetical protein TVAGG3_0049930 [Trichomonas vaginalis G3]KAI5541319.1 hypothetical protein TVAGG3_0049930 [Trichomonas vaginalis G3]